MVLESFYLGVQKHKNASGNFFSQLTTCNKRTLFSLFRFKFHFISFLSKFVFTWHAVWPSACCNEKIIKTIFCFQILWCCKPWPCPWWPAPGATCCHWSDRPQAGWLCRAFQKPELEFNWFVVLENYLVRCTYYLLSWAFILKANCNLK